MNTQQLSKNILKKKSFLCIGLDTDIKKVPKHFRHYDDPVFEFNKEIINYTHEFAAAYKPNTAFYEANGAKGWNSLAKTIDYLNQNHPDIFTIADAKRGDIGNTSSLYARAFFEELNFDSVTVAPYMGRDSVEPFLEFEDKITILLALTSNEGADDFQFGFNDGQELYKRVIERSARWKNSQNLMYVVGATKADYLAEIRSIAPHAFLLVPGVGAQGGSLNEVCRHGMNDSVGLLVNSSRQIIYASSGEDFADKARIEAQKIQSEMAQILDIWFE